MTAEERIIALEEQVQELRDILAQTVSLLRALGATRIPYPQDVQKRF